MVDGVADLKHTSREVRRLILEMALRSKTAHVGSAFCIADILTVLYFRTMNIKVDDPSSPHRDRFILSKGHAAAALYATLALRGFFPLKKLDGYCMDGGTLHGHPCKDAAPGIEFSTGSLGHGLSVVAGVALALYHENNPARVYTLMGDGECNEGSVWEAAMFIGSRKLNNVTAIVDDNKWQAFGRTKEVLAIDLGKMWVTLGWNVQRVDGHNHEALEAALAATKEAAAPSVIIADTVAGKGMATIEDTQLAHYLVPDAAAVETTTTELYAQ